MIAAILGLFEYPMNLSEFLIIWNAKTPYQLFAQLMGNVNEAYSISFSLRNYNFGYYLFLETKKLS